MSKHNVIDVASSQHPCPKYCSISSFRGMGNAFVVLTDIENLSVE